MELTPPPAAVFSCCQVDKSKVSNSSSKMSSPLQMVAGALVPMALVTDGTQSDKAVASVHTSIRRDFMAILCSFL
jgi:hypothetical protein